MNDYIIKITKDAKNDLKLIRNYLSYNLQEPQIVKNVMEKLKKNIKSLSYFPERFPIVRDYYLSMNSLRKCTMNNYIIFYIVDKNEKIVHIIRIVYGKMDWL